MSGRSRPRPVRWGGIAAVLLLAVALSLAGRLPSSRPAPAPAGGGADSGAPVACAVAAPGAVALAVEGGAYVIDAAAEGGPRLGYFAAAAPGARQAPGGGGAVPGPQEPVRSLSFSALPFGPELSSACGPALALCDPASGAWGVWRVPQASAGPAIQRAPGAAAIACDAAGGVAVAVADGRQADGAGPADVVLWTGGAAPEVRLAPSGNVMGVALARSGQWLAIAVAGLAGDDVDYRVVLYDRAGAEVWRRPGLAAPPQIMAFSPGGRWLILAAEDRILCLDVAGGSLRWQARLGPCVFAVGVDDAGRAAVAAGPDSVPRLVMLDPQGRRSWSRPLAGLPVAVSFPAPEGLAVADRDGLTGVAADGTTAWRWRGGAAVMRASGGPDGLTAVLSDGTLCVVAPARLAAAASAARGGGAGGGMGGGGDRL